METQQKLTRSRIDGKNTWKNYIKKELNEADSYDSMVSHPEPNMMECEVKQALRSTAVNNTSGCDEIPAAATAAAAAVKSLQSCPTLCDPIDGRLPGSPVPGILQARTLEWVAISFSNA